MFDGACLKNEDIRSNFTDFALEALNKNRIPKYLKRGRMMALSKTGKAEARLDEIRPINILSHITKVFEKAIKIKLAELKSSILKS